MYPGENLTLQKIKAIQILGYIDAASNFLVTPASPVDRNKYK